MQQQRSTAT
uniref:Uncharacterized protein n=1 Tax=Arundo donax TaxID=35708 RepID=A0A0A9AZM0_ARUDO